MCRLLAEVMKFDTSSEMFWGALVVLVGLLLFFRWLRGLRKK